MSKFGDFVQTFRDLKLKQVVSSSILFLLVMDVSLRIISSILLE